MNDHEEFRISGGQPSAARGEARPPVPRIRFKEFGGAWETRPLGELFSIRNESNESGEVREILSVLKDVGVIPYSEKGRIGNRAKDDVTKYRIARKGDIVLNSMNVIIGSVGYSAYDGCISPVYYALTPNENADSPFWGRWFWRNEAKQMLSRVACGMMEIRRKVSEADLLEIQTPAPSLPEQRRIAELFRNLDETIAATDARLEKLRQSKKSLLEKMFPRPGASVPEIRFKGFEGEWKTRKLGEIATLITRKNTAMESNLPLTISAERGLISQTTYFNNRIAAQNVVHYYLILNGEFAYNRSSSDGSPFGAVKRLDSFGKGVLSTLYTVFALKKKTVDSDFLSVFFSTGLWHRDVRLRAAEGARNHGLLNISASDFFETEVLSPVSISEQQRIGSFFRELDKLIESVQKKTTKLRQVKSALLEEMFV